MRDEQPSRDYSYQGASLYQQADLRKEATALKKRLRKEFRGIKVSAGYTLRIVNGQPPALVVEGIIPGGELEWWSIVL